jgi:hypothetical protein
VEIRERVREVVVPVYIQERQPAAAAPPKSEQQPEPTPA